MKNITEYFINENKISDEVINDLKETLKTALTNKNSINVSVEGLNNRFYNRIGGYAIESYINQILSPNDTNCELDAVFNGVNIEIKSIKDKKYSSINRMIPASELPKVKNGILLLVDYSGTETYTINKIYVIKGSELSNSNVTVSKLKNSDANPIEL